MKTKVVDKIQAGHILFRYHKRLRQNTLEPWSNIPEDITRMLNLAQDFTLSEYFLVIFLDHLWGNTESFKFRDFIKMLDDDDFNAVIETIKFIRTKY